MGWSIDDAPSCEGWVRGLIRRDGRLIDLAYPDRHGDVEVRPDEIQIECECGWRSPRMPAPLSATWSPFSVMMRGDDEDTACELWVEHARSLAGCDPHEALWSHRKKREGR